MRGAIVLLFVLAAGCGPTGLTDLSKYAGFQAPADFTKGVGETKFFQSTDGKTVFWEVPFFNNTDRPMYCTVSPSVTVKDHQGKIVWSGQDSKNWTIQPGGQGRVGGKIVIPEEVLRPTLHWEEGNVPSASGAGQAERR